MTGVLAGLGLRVPVQLGPRSRKRAHGLFSGTLGCALVVGLVAAVVFLGWVLVAWLRWVRVMP